MKNLKIGAIALATLLLVSVNGVNAEIAPEGATCSNWGEWTYNSTSGKDERTCIDDATITESVDHVHNYGEWTYNNTSGKDERTCTDDATHTEEREHVHNWGEWIYNGSDKDVRTCTDDSTHTEERDHEHKYGAWVYDYEAGEKVRECACGHKEVEKIPTSVYVPTIDTKEETKTVIVGVSTDQAKADSILKDSLAKAKGYDANKTYHIYVDIDNEYKDEDGNDYGINLKTSDVVKIQNLLKKDHPNAVIGSFFNINIVAYPNGNGDRVLIEELTEKLTFNVAIPKNLKEVPAGYNRVYYIIRIHGDSTEVIPASVQPDGTLAFESDKFSTYAIAYEDVKVETSVPKTYDSVDSYKALGSISVMGLIGTGLFLKKKRFN